MLRAVLIHLRIPFSVFLLPVFLFALSEVASPDWAKVTWVFAIIHLLLYPASNAYNSYYDQDEGSIGLIKNPPPARPELLYTAWGFDILAVVLAIALGLGAAFVGYLLVYGTVSKLYSHPAVRLKKRPILSWLIIGLFQGSLTYLAVVQCLGQEPFSALWSWPHLLPALICATNLWAVYPLTQVYQHEEDARRNDLTLSRLLDIRGTFWLAFVFFSLSFLGYIIHFGEQPATLLLLVACMGPGLGYFMYWWWLVSQDSSLANYTHTMRLNFIASAGLNLFFGIYCVLIW